MILKDFLGVRKVSIPGFLGVGNIDKVFSGWLDLSRFFLVFRTICRSVVVPVYTRYTGRLILRMLFFHFMFLFFVIYLILSGNF